MQNTKYSLSQDDQEIWQAFTSHLQDDKDIISPKYTYNEITSRKLDLHDYTVNEAWIRFKEFINMHYSNGDKSVVVITGRTGQIASEFIAWCSKISIIRAWEPISRNNGPAGSFRVYLKRKI